MAANIGDNHKRQSLNSASAIFPALALWPRRVETKSLSFRFSSQGAE
jgi:hypothetical protein